MKAAARRLVLLLTCAVVLIAFVALVGVFGLHHPRDGHGQTVTFLVHHGQSFAEVNRELVDHGLVSSWAPLRIWAELTSIDRRILPGEYEVSAAQSPLDIVAILGNGHPLLRSVTIAEGLARDEIIDLIAKEVETPVADLRAAANDADWLFSLGLTVPDLQGYLFPETYLFEREADAKRVLGAMVRASFAQRTPARSQRADTLGLSWHQVLTLASIIEAEAAKSFERSRISAVYHNRLAAGWLMQADPTVAYAVGKPAAQLTSADLTADSPYNTYKYTGLPPGPICCPGSSSIDAALWPLWGCLDLYFVARGDGTHVFSRSLADHNHACQYLRERNQRTK